MCENYVQLMASSSTYAFFQSAVEVPHCLLQHLSWDTTNFFLDSLFQFIQSPWPSGVDPILKVAPQEEITNGQIRWCCGPGNFTESWDDTVTEQFSHSCHWLSCSVRCRTILLKPGFVKLWKIVHCRCIAASQHTDPKWQSLWSALHFRKSKVRWPRVTKLHTTPSPCCCVKGVHELLYGCCLPSNDSSACSRKLWDENGPHLTSTACPDIHCPRLCLSQFVDRILIATGDRSPSVLARSAACTDEILNQYGEFGENSLGTTWPQLLA